MSELVLGEVQGGAGRVHGDPVGLERLRTAGGTCSWSKVTTSQ